MRPKPKRFTRTERAPPGSVFPPRCRRAEARVVYEHIDAALFADHALHASNEGGYIVGHVECDGMIARVFDIVHFCWVRRAAP